MDDPYTLPPMSTALLFPERLGMGPSENGTNNKMKQAESNKMKPAEDMPRDPRRMKRPVPDQEDGEIGRESAAGVPRKKGRVPCKYWMEGKCSKGEECTFSHALTPNRTAEQLRALNSAGLTNLSSLLPSLAASASIYDVLTQGICKYHMLTAGSCSKGDRCLFSHDVHRVPCKFYHAWGRCAAGGGCRFSHDPLPVEVARRIKLEAATAVQKERPRCRESDERKIDGDLASGDALGAGVSRSALSSTATSSVAASNGSPDEELFNQELAKQLNPFHDF